jgi:hypothetical protein
VNGVEITAALFKSKEETILCKIITGGVLIKNNELVQQMPKEKNLMCGGIIDMLWTSCHI